MNDDAWSNFIASINPVELEAERYRPPGPEERPGSTTDLRMKAAHQFLADDYWARVRSGHAPPLPDDEWLVRRAAQNADADAEIARRGYGQPAADDDIEAAIRSYSQRQAATAAERNAA
ncbi:hypothetical protein [Curtobacterium sp. Arg-1]|uniref:hypothetical protein n=1 Tax=Curtobacterium sp. Arg-1 TaxID=2935040 RepID=UPI0021D9AD29|nr:hypothetical protein [Curtobacterium sp. Arg-1]UXZ57065.1 hypothetical protein MXD64_13805 [Curtobacterium sp. Arg-1]